MCIGNTTSPAATNTTNVRYGTWGDPDDWDRPEVIPPGPMQMEKQGKWAGQRDAQKESLKAKAKPKSQSSKTSGGTY